MRLKTRLKGHYSRFIMKRALKRNTLPKDSLKHYRAMSKAGLDIK